MKDIRNYIIAALLVLLICDIVFRKVPEPELDKHDLVISQKTLENVNLRAQVRQLKARRTTDSLNEIATLKRFKIEKRKADAELAAVPTLATASAPELDSLGDALLPAPKTDTLYAMDIGRARAAFSEVMKSRAKDKIIKVLDARVAEVTAEKDTAVATLNKELASEKAISANKDTIISETQGKVEDKTKENKKLQRQNKVLKIFVPVVGVGSALATIFITRD